MTCVWSVVHTVSMKNTDTTPLAVASITGVACEYVVTLDLSADRDEQYVVTFVPSGPARAAQPEIEHRGPTMLDALSYVGRAVDYQLDCERQS